MLYVLLQLYPTCFKCVFKCFICFILLLQVFHIDVTKVDRGATVAYCYCWDVAGSTHVGSPCGHGVDVGEWSCDGRGRWR
jgi:hypothetical protein